MKLFASLCILLFAQNNDNKMDMDDFLRVILDDLGYGEKKPQVTDLDEDSQLSYDSYQSINSYN